MDGLVDLEEPAGLRPQPEPGLDAPPKQDDLAAAVTGNG